MSFAELRTRLSAADAAPATHAVAISSRVRLARNLDEPFLHTLGPGERRLLRDRLLDRLRDLEVCAGAVFLEEERLADHERRFLVESNPFDHAESGVRGEAGLVYLPDPRRLICVGIGDHLSIRCRAAGLDLDAIWMQADHIDSVLEEAFGYAFSEAFGYLNPDPASTGTGLEIACLLHLPALAMGGDLQRIFRGLSALKLEVSSPDHWATPNRSPYFQLSSHRGLGRTEQDFIETMVDTVARLTEFEAKARESMLSEARPLQPLLHEQVWSAFGQVKYGRCIDEMRSRELLGNLRLGILAGIIQDVALQDVEAIRSKTGTGFIHCEAGETLGETRTNQIRAERLREWLAERHSE